jgi:uncharacterized protein
MYLYGTLRYSPPYRRRHPMPIQATTSPSNRAETKSLLQCLYIHGFASGPSSTKANFFADNLRQLGFTVHVPDMNGDNFSDLTITSQLQIIERLEKNAGSDLLVIGSSMGGLMSVLAANRFPSIKALVLMAPAFGLNKRWPQRLGAKQFQEWRELGTLQVYHYGFERDVPLKYTFIEDAASYQTEDIKVKVPTLVMHGTNDTVVPCTESERFHLLNPEYVEFHTVNSDHGLTDCLPKLWSFTTKFMEKHDLLSAEQLNPC